MRLIRKKEIKFVKLFLISPYLEQAMNLLYLISLPIIIFKFLHIPNNLTNYEINDLVRKSLYETEFENITTPKHLLNYIEHTLKLLYAPPGIPTLLPLGSIRLKRFSIKNECNVRCSYSDQLDTDNTVCELVNSNTNNIQECASFYSSDNSQKKSSFYKTNTNQTFYDNVIGVNFLVYI